jgi:hypothetical protein
MRRFVWVSLLVLGVVSGAAVPSSATNSHDPLMLEKTVGIDPTTCAAAKNIVVQKGTTVTYCYTISNHDVISYTMHSLEDSVLGPITLPSGGNFDLLPGGSASVTATYQINTTTINVATWTAVATDTDGMTTDVVAAPQITTASAVSSAQVSIAATNAPALGEGALAMLTAGLLAFGAARLSRKRRGSA